MRQSGGAGSENLMSSRKMERQGDDGDVDRSVRTACLGAREALRHLQSSS